MGFYVKGILALVVHSQGNVQPNPLQILSTIFSPTLIIAFIIGALTSLANRVLGIVLVVKSKTVSDGEKAIWILGFILLSFITSIVFLIMAKGKKLVD
jgi:hypothetical protein